MYQYQKAKLARTYGWTDYNIENLPYREYLAYLKCADILRAEDNLQLLDVVDYPQADKRARKKIFEHLKSSLKLVKFHSGPISYGELKGKIKKALKGQNG